MNPDTLTALLNDATDTVEPSAGFADAVLRSGRRRQVRRRLTVVAGAAVAVALVAGGAYLTSYQDTEKVTTAHPLLAEPTKGDLAGDKAFVDQAKELWQIGLARSPEAPRHIYDDMRGQPHVYWAGNTPAGRAAVVVQQHYVHQNNQLHQNAGGLRTAAGLVAIDPADGELKLVTDQWESDAPNIATRIGQFQFGPDDRTILVATTGTPIFYSPGSLVRDGKVVRDWQAMPEQDGVAVVELPADADPAMAVVVEQKTKPAPDHTKQAGSVRLLPAGDYFDWANGTGPTAPPPHNGIPWQNPALTAGGTGGPQFDVEMTFFSEVTVKTTTGEAAGSTGGAWYIRAGLPDGRVAVLGDVQNGTNPARFYALLVTPEMEYEVYDGGDVDAAEPLPVHFRMPDEQGWVIAQLNQPLKYRTSTDGDWQDAGTSAALVPDETVQVMVGETVVDLPR